MRTILSWSGGKDCYQALRELGADVVALLATYNKATLRLAFHEVHIELLQAQADALGLPLVRVALPPDPGNSQYESALLSTLQRIRFRLRVGAIAFGDIHLADVRDYRETLLAGSGYDLCFPLWGRDTGELSGALVADDLQAVVTCVDTTLLPPELLLAHYDEEFLAALPPGVDPCGENGEFHTFVTGGQLFSKTIACFTGPVVSLHPFLSQALLPAGGDGPAERKPAR